MEKVTPEIWKLMARCISGNSRGNDKLELTTLLNNHAEMRRTYNLLAKMYHTPTPLAAINGTKLFTDINRRIRFANTNVEG
jgi:hypothetical protein